MENRSHALAAGLFALVLGAALIAAAFWIRGEPITHDQYVLHTRGSVNGLNPQAAVRYRGVEVGKVESIAFDPGDPRTILVQISVMSGMPITRGTYGQLAAQGITGLSYVQLEDDGTSAELRDPRDAQQARIELRPSFLDRFTGSGEVLVARLGNVAAQLEVWLADDNRSQALRTLVALERAAEGIRTISDGAQASLKAVPELARRAGNTLQQADLLLADLRTLSATLSDRSQAVERVATSAERIGTSVEQLAQAGQAFALVAGNETLPRLHGLFDDLARSSRTLDRLLQDLSAHPSSVVFGRPPARPGPGEPGFAFGASR
jgi:phospholipid/cholesterol/gamma-HCH transport system substrate-binding protein